MQDQPITDTREKVTDLVPSSDEPEALTFAMTIDYDADRVARGNLTESKRVISVRVTGWPGITAIEMADALEDVVREVPLVAQQYIEEAGR